ncbi:MAG: helix-turn-helix domain-containing protein [Bacteroidia bacterium]
MNLDPLSLFYVLGALQSLIFLIGINLNKPLAGTLKQTASLVLIAIAVATFYYVVTITQNEVLYPYVDSLGGAAWMAFCPLLYLFSCAVVDAQFRLRWWHLAMFPVSLWFLLEGLLTNMGYQVWLYLWFDELRSFIDAWMLYFFSTGLFFTIKSIMRLQGHDRFIFRSELKFFTRALLAVLTCFAIAYLIIRGNYHAYFEYSLIALFCMMIFWLLFKIMKAVEVKAFVGNVKMAPVSGDSNSYPQAARNLATVMQNEKPYLNAKLSLSSLAAMVDMSENDLSQLLNKHHRKNYYEFVNEYRVMHIEGLFEQGMHDQYTIISLAEQSGFNSKATFYKAFREKHGMTPSQYIKGVD